MRSTPRYRLLALLCGATVALVAFAPMAGAAPASTYEVRPGDTLSGIAARFGVSVSALAAANGISDPNRLVSGATLTIPSPGSPSTSMGGRVSTGVTGQYTVKAGDTWWGIARRYGTTAEALAHANGTSSDAVIHPGKVLAVPGGATPSPPPLESPTVSTGKLPARIRSDPERLALVGVFDAAAAEFGVPADLLKSVGYMESGWQSDVVSYKGAMGIGQLMPETAAELARRMGDPTLDPWDPNDNIRMSARYLRMLLDLNGGDSSAALADYYQGHASVQRRGLDTDTARYVAIIQGNRPLFS